MARYAFIKATKVVNVIIGDAAFVAANTPQGCTAQLLPDASPVCPGWTWNGSAFAEPTPDPEEIRKGEIDQAIASDNVIALLKSQTSQQYDVWWAENVTNAAQAISLLKRLVRVVVRRLL